MPIEVGPQVEKRFAGNKQNMALAHIFIKLVLYVYKPPLHLSLDDTLQVCRDFPPIRICDRHVLPNYTGALVAEDADDFFWLQGLSMWPYLVYGMHLDVNLVPPVLAPLLATALGTSRFGRCAWGGTGSIPLHLSRVLVLGVLQTPRHHRNLYSTIARISFTVK